MTSARRYCLQCGATLARVGPQLLCPGCLLEAGLTPTHLAPLTPPDPLAPLAPPGAPDNPPIPYLRQFGNYELLDEIAQGGMGVVYRARQIGLERLVAVKLLLSGPLASSDQVQRFRSEAAAAASLQHPNIVAIHEVGFCDGQHFIAMDYIHGRSLGEIVHDGPLDARRAATYVETIARAIHFAHEHKILHRDLKPSNVLIDDSDTPHITDFGLAKRLEMDSPLTLSGQMLGSPAYMPPEQLEAHRGRVDPRSDVYSLGAILFHLLTGRAPFAANSVAGMLHQVAHDNPVSPRLLIPGLPSDLETICLKCLEKEPHRRYPSALALADELARFKRHEPILARPVSPPERLWRWAKRKPALASLVVALHLVAAMGLSGIVWQWLRAKQSTIEAQTQRNLAEGRLYATQMREAHAEYARGNHGGALALLQSWWPTPGRPDWRGFEWRWLHRLCQTNLGEIIATNVAGFSAAAASHNGQFVALGATDGTVLLIDLRNGTRSESWQAHPGSIDSLAFVGPGPAWLATVGADDGKLKLWDRLRSREIAVTNCAKGHLLQISVSPSGKWLVVGAPAEPRVNVWQVSRLADGRPVLALRHTIDSLGPATFSPDENTLALANHGHHGGVALYDLNRNTCTELHPSHGNFVEAVAFSPDGQWLATGGSDQTVAIWDVQRRQRQHQLASGVQFNVAALTFSSDSRRLFAAGTDQNIHGWELNNPGRMLTLRGHATSVAGLTFGMSPTPTLFSAGADGTARRWSIDDQFLATASTLPPTYENLETSPGPCLSLAVSPARQTIVVSHFHRISLLDLERRRPVRHLDSAQAFSPHPNGVHAVAFSPDGAHLALGGSKGWLALLDATTLRAIRPPLKAHPDEITHLAFASGGRLLVSGSRFGGGIQLIDVQKWHSLTNLDNAGHHPRPAFAVNIEGTRLLAGGLHQTVNLWDIHEPRNVRLLATCPQRIRFLHAAAFAPDHQRVALGDHSGALYLWDTSRQESPRRLQAHKAIIMSLAFSPDGRTLASAGADHTVRLWHPDIDEPTAVLTGHRSWIFEIAFAAHGEALVSGDHDGIVNIWHTSN